LAAMNRRRLCVESVQHFTAVRAFSAGAAGTPQNHRGAPQRATSA
jgi:hypothetical protein